MLAILQKGNLPKEVESNQGIDLYFLIDHHIKRAIGYTSANWTFNSPYYYLDENDVLKRKGSFDSGRPFISLLYEKFLNLKEKSNFLKLINLNLPLIISDRHIYLTYQIIEESNRLYESQFNSTFYVVLHPSYFTPEYKLKLIELFKKNGINYLDYSTRKYRKYTIPNDGHPTYKLNKFFSDDLVKDLLSERLN